MIRISTATEPAATTITVDGRLAGEYVDAVETCSNQAIGQGRPVHLFLRDVSLIDERGRALLVRLADKGVEMTARGIYSSFIVTEISREHATRSRRRGYVTPRAASLSRTNGKPGALPYPGH